MKKFIRTISIVTAALMVGGTVFAAVAANTDKTITLQIGNPVMKVNGADTNIDDNGTAPIIVNDRTMLPLRAVLEALGAQVEWDAQTSTVTITAKEGENEMNPNLAKRVTPDEEYYIFDLDDEVTREHVYYKTRFGIELAGDLYMPKNADLTQKYPAVVIGPPFGGVKEQGPGVYANQLAKRGFVCLAFDPSYHCYSGGETRMTGSTATYVEDFSAGVDYLGSLDYVDREKIAAIGICGSGGFALSAASMDSRIKAVIPCVMYDIAGNMNSRDGDARKGMIDMASQQRWAAVDSGEMPYNKMYPDEPADSMPEGLDGTNAEFFSFYGMKRGWHPNALGNVTAPSMADIMTFPSSDHINSISPRPILFVVGENAHSRGFSDTAYEAAAEPKEMYVVPDANHVDLYDDITKIPFDKIESFLNEVFNK